MGHNFKPSISRMAPVQATDIKRASIQAARLIESAMHRCTKDDVGALDCLLEARRALSPIVDFRNGLQKIDPSK